MPLVWQQFSAAQVIFAGAAAESTAALRQSNDERVLVRNNISEAEKHALLTACDVLVLPSTEESFGIVFIEAWAHGKPVIGANVGAVASLIAEGVDGRLFAPEDAGSLADAITEILGQPDAARMMGTAGKRKVHENYTWDAVTATVRETYLQAIKNHR